MDTNTALNLQSQYRYEESITILRDAAQSAARSLPELQAFCLEYLGVAYFALFRYPEAMDALDGALQIYERCGLNPATVSTLTKRSAVCLALGRIGPAEEDLFHALRYSTTAEDSMVVLIRIGELERHLADYERAEQSLKKALLLIDKHKSTALRPAALEDLGNVCADVNDTTNARTYYQQALDALRASGLDSDRARVTLDYGTMLPWIPDDLLQTSVELPAGGRMDVNVAVALALGDRQLARGKIARARTHFEFALHNAETLGNIPLFAATQSRMSAILNRDDQPEESLKRSDAVFRLLDSDMATLEPELLLSAYSERGESLLRLGRYPEACDALLSAIALTESVRSRLMISRRRGLFSTSHMDAYDQMVSLIVELRQRSLPLPQAIAPYGPSHEDAAWFFLEIARARGLFEQLFGARERCLVPASPGGTSAEWLRLSQQVSLEDRRLRAMDGHPAPYRHVLAARSVATTRELTAYLEDIAGLSEAGGSGLMQPTIPRLATLPLYGDEALIYYSVMVDGSCALVVRPGAPAALVPLRLTQAKAESLAVSLRSSLVDPTRKFSSSNESHQLFRYLVAPVIPYLANAHRITIIPDDALSDIPLDILSPEPHTAPSSGSAIRTIWADECNISYYPSGTLLSMNRGRSSRNQRWDHEILAVSPGAGEDDSSQGEAVSWVRDVFVDRSRPPDMLLGNEATRAGLTYFPQVELTISCAGSGRSP